MLLSDSRNLAALILSRPGAKERIFRMDGSINQNALQVELARHQEICDLTKDMDVPSKVGRRKEKGWKGLKSASPGRMSGHRRGHR